MGKLGASCNTSANTCYALEHKLCRIISNYQYPGYNITKTQKIPKKMIRYVTVVKPGQFRTLFCKMKKIEYAVLMIDRGHKMLLVVYVKKFLLTN